MSACRGEWGSGHVAAQASAGSGRGARPSLRAQGPSGRAAESPGRAEHVSTDTRTRGQPEAGSPASAWPDPEGWLLLVQKGREVLAHDPQRPGPEPTGTAVQFRKTGSENRRHRLSSGAHSLMPETAQRPQLNTKGRSKKKTPVRTSHTEMWTGRERPRKLLKGARDGVLMPGQSAPRDSLPALLRPRPSLHRGLTRRRRLGERM